MGITISDETILHQALTRERHWLAGQIGFDDWEGGCSAVVDQCHAWASAYAAERFDGGWLSDASRDECAARLWDVWSFHWKDEHFRTRHAVDGFDVARQIQAGRRNGTPPRVLGGDPLSDVVFVRLAPQRVNEAWPRLVNDYESVFEQEGRRLYGRRLDSDQWRDIVSRLFAADRAARPRLWGYRGYSSLRTWLRPVVRNYLLDGLRRGRAFFQADQSVVTFGPTDDAAAKESADWFHETLRAALVALPERERTALLLYTLRWPNKSIARRLAVSAGQASRIRSDAVTHLAEALFAVSPARFAELQEMAGLNEQLFSSILSEVIMGKTADLKRPNKTGPNASHLKTLPAPKAKARRAAEVVDKIGTARIVAAQEPAIERPTAKDYLPGDDAIHVVTPGRRPSEVFDALATLDVERRPTVVCLDARDETLAASVTEWLEEFDARVNEQFNADSPDEPIVLHIVTVVTEAIDPVPPLRSEMTVLTEPPGRSAIEVYRAFLEDRLTQLLDSSPTLRPVEPDPEARPPRHRTSGQKAVWQTRLRQLKEWSDDSTSSVD